MRILPTTADSNFAVMDFFIMVGAVLVPAIIALLVWAIFFKNRRRRKRRRRRDYGAANPALARNPKPASQQAEDLSGHPKS